MIDHAFANISMAQIHTVTSNGVDQLNRFNIKIDESRAQKIHNTHSIPFVQFEFKFCCCFLFLFFLTILKTHLIYQYTKSMIIIEQKNGQVQNQCINKHKQKSHNDPDTIVRSTKSHRISEKKKQRTINKQTKTYGKKIARKKY